eukprot:Opistho-2@27973
MNLIFGLRGLFTFVLFIVSVVYFSAIAYSTNNNDLQGSNCFLFYRSASSKCEGCCGYVIAEGVIVMLSCLGWVVVGYAKRTTSTGQMFPTVDLIMAFLLAILTLVAGIIVSAGFAKTCDGVPKCNKLKGYSAVNTAQGAVWVAFVLQVVLTVIMFISRRNARSADKEAAIRTSVPGLAPTDAAGPKAAI